MRHKDYKIGKVEKFLVYTSEDSWWAEFTILQQEGKTAGNSRQLNFPDYSKVAQQKGDMFMDRRPSSRPLVKEGEVKVGTITLEPKVCTR